MSCQPCFLEKSGDTILISFFQDFIDLIHFKKSRVKVRAVPIPHLLIILISRITDCFQKSLVARGAANVFRGAGILASQKDRVFECFFARGGNALDPYFMLPAVPKVIDLHTPLPNITFQFVQRKL